MRTFWRSAFTSDKDVASVTGFTGGGRANSGFMFISLNPLDERTDSAQDVINRLRVTLRMNGRQSVSIPVQDVRVGGRESNSSYQYSCWRMIYPCCVNGEPKIPQSAR